MPLTIRCAGCPREFVWEPKNETSTTPPRYHATACKLRTRKKRHHEMLDRMRSGAGFCADSLRSYEEADWLAKKDEISYKCYCGGYHVRKVEEVAV